MPQIWTVETARERFEKDCREAAEKFAKRLLSIEDAEAREAYRKELEEKKEQSKREQYEKTVKKVELDAELAYLANVKRVHSKEIGKLFGMTARNVIRRIGEFQDYKFKADRIRGHPPHKMKRSAKYDLSAIEAAEERARLKHEG